MSLGRYLSDATSLEAQLALSYLVWPKNAPHPRAVDEWVRRQGVGWLRMSAEAPSNPHADGLTRPPEVT